MDDPGHTPEDVATRARQPAGWSPALLCGLWVMPLMIAAGLAADHWRPEFPDMNLRPGLAAPAIAGEPLSPRA